MDIHQVEQNTPEWYELRQGRPTASSFGKIITPKTGKPSSQRKQYLCELVAESFCPDHEDAWAYTGNLFNGNKFTNWGHEYEPYAREEFSKFTGLNVEEVGFVTDASGVLGCSPDGLIKDDDGNWIAGVEIKCKTLKAHIECFQNGVLPDEHKGQVHGSMIVTGLDTWHFFSYFPGIQPLHVKVERDEFTEQLKTALDQFMAEYRELRKSLIPELSLAS